MRAMSDSKGYSARHLEHSDYYAEGERVLGGWFGCGAELPGLCGAVMTGDSEAVRQGHICREEREQKGRKNLTNILRIMSLEWLAWIKRGPIGCKVFSATKIIDSKQEALERSKREFPRVARILRVSG